MSDLCLDCDRPIEQPGRGRRRKYCVECRPPAERIPRHKPAPRPRVTECAQCGAPSKRMYCSQQCRDASRRVPCAGCRKPIYHSITSLPVGQATCRECRAAVPRRKVFDKRSPCADCGSPSYGQRCRKCSGMRRRTGRSQTAKKLLQARRIDRDRQAPGLYTATRRRELLATWKRQGRSCVYCSDAPAQTVDHVLPLALGGTNYEGNLAPSCIACNRSKLDNLLSAWRYGIKIRKWRVPVEPRMPKPRPRRERVWVQTALNLCGICGTLHARRSKYCTNDCMWEANARRARDRYRLTQGLPVDGDVPTTPTRRARGAA